jgi:hypothetical protein
LGEDRWSGQIDAEVAPCMALAHTLPQRRDDAIIVSEPSAEVRYEFRTNGCVVRPV